MLVVAGPAELAEAASPVWGTGGWDPPETREARDWWCLARLCGWRADVGDDPLGPAERFVVLTGGAPVSPALRERLQREPLLAVCRADTLEGEVVAHRDGRPVAALCEVGAGAILTLGVHPSEVRDADGAWTALLRDLLVTHARAPVAALDWTGTLVLRMDDPGSSESAHRDGWRYPKLGRAAWAAIGADLRRRDGRLSVAYVPMFADGLDVVPSREVVRDDFDGADEHAGLAEQLAAGTVDVQLHGYTHVHPDRAAWIASADRGTAESWYRELVPAADLLTDAEHPLPLGFAEVERAFGAAPRVLVCPGDAWTTDALTRALHLPLDLVSSYYLALRGPAGWVWCQHVCAPYLDRPDPAWFAAGLPVVGSFHDMEPSVHGTAWLAEQLDAWAAAGARRLISLGDLAEAM